MITLQKVVFLKSMPLFKDVKEEVLLAVASIVEEHLVPNNTPIILKGELGDTMFIIARGKVQVHDGERNLAQMGEGDVVGELSALVPDKRNADVTTIEETLFLTVSHAVLYELMEQNFGLSKGIIYVLCQRLRKLEKL